MWRGSGCSVCDRVDLSAAPPARHVAVVVGMTVPMRGEQHEAISLLQAPKWCQTVGAMKATLVQQFGDPSVMKLEEVADTAADLGQVLVDVKASGVNPVDTYIRSGQYPSLPPLP